MKNTLVTVFYFILPDERIRPNKFYFQGYFSNFQQSCSYLLHHLSQEEWDVLVNSTYFKLFCIAIDIIDIIFFISQI